MTSFDFPPSGDADKVECDLTRLTGIPNEYTLASTPEPESETDKLMINHFLTTLAEVALAVTSRNLRDELEGGT